MHFLSVINATLYEALHKVIGSTYDAYYPTNAVIFITTLPQLQTITTAMHNFHCSMFRLR
jgi:hypothetical protein